ncbi:MAG: hypothetical protein HY606_07630 [Planctomycetes bacterium]|nr:hypothetical protein [Planctomycetota bacterium]
MLAALKVAVGKTRFNQRKFDDAILIFDEVITTLSGSGYAAEAMYWKGVAAYRKSKGDKEVLHDLWQQLYKKYPASEWAKRVAYQIKSS